MSRIKYRPRYGSRVFETLKRINEEEVRKSGDECSVCFSRLYKAGLIIRKKTNFSTCPYYYYITQEGGTVLEDIIKKEEEKQKEAILFNTF